MKVKINIKGKIRNVATTVKNEPEKVLDGVKKIAEAASLVVSLAGTVKSFKQTKRGGEK